MTRHNVSDGESRLSDVLHLLPINYNNIVIAYVLTINSQQLDASMARWLRHSAANLRVVDSIPARTCVCRNCFLMESPFAHMFQVRQAPRLNNNDNKHWCNTGTRTLAGGFVAYYSNHSAVRAPPTVLYRNYYSRFLEFNINNTLSVPKQGTGKQNDKLNLA